jgi:hypothetical protein
VNNHGPTYIKLLKLGQNWCKWPTTIGSGWWFGTFFIFPYWEFHHPNWLSLHDFSVGWRKTTNQIYIYIQYII